MSPTPTLIRQVAANGGISISVDDRGTRQFATTILTELLDERLQWRHIVDELTSSTLPQASPDPGGSAAPPGSSP